MTGVYVSDRVADMERTHTAEVEFNATIPGYDDDAHISFTRRITWDEDGISGDDYTGIRVSFTDDAPPVVFQQLSPVDQEYVTQAVEWYMRAAPDAPEPHDNDD